MSQQDTAELRKRYKDFFDPIIRSLKAAGEGPRTLNVIPEGNDRGFESQKFAPLCFNFGFWGPNNGDRHRPYVYLWIRESDGRRSRQIFEQLRADQKAMEEELRRVDPRFKLNRWSDTTGSSNPKAKHYRSVGMMIDGTINDPQQRLDEIRDWMLAFYPVLKDVMERRLEKI